MNDLSCKYIKYLSLKGDFRDSPLLLEMMDRYGVTNLRSLTDEQIAKFYNEVIESERESEVLQHDKTNKVQKTKTDENDDCSLVQGT